MSPAVIRRLLGRFRAPAPAQPSVTAAAPEQPVPELLEEKAPDPIPAGPVTPPIEEAPADCDGLSLYLVRYDAGRRLGRSNGGNPPKPFLTWAADAQELARLIERNVAPYIGHGAGAIVDLTIPGGQISVGVDRLGTFSVEILHTAQGDQIG